MGSWGRLGRPGHKNIVHLHGSTCIPGARSAFHMRAHTLACKPLRIYMTPAPTNPHFMSPPALSQAKGTGQGRSPDQRGQVANSPCRRD